MAKLSGMYLTSNYDWACAHTYRDKHGVVRCINTHETLYYRAEHRMRPAESSADEPYTVHLNAKSGTMISFSVVWCRACNEGTPSAPEEVRPSELIFARETTG
jgi:hypothetical protein